MKKPVALITLFAIHCLLVVPTSAQVPQLINYQGRLIDGTNLVNGQVNMQIAIWTNSTASGTALYVDSNKVDVVDGLYSTIIGDGTIAGSLTNALASSNIYVGVKVNGVQLLPAEPLSSVAYALTANGVRPGGVGAAALANNVVTGDKIADGTISNADLAVASVTSETIAAGEVTADDVDVATFSNTFWKTDGNAGTQVGVAFVGTTDGEPLDLRVNGARALRLIPNGTSPSFSGGHSANTVSVGVAGAVIGGGGSAAQPNFVTDNYGTVGGGTFNRAGNSGGGVADAEFATVGGGSANGANGKLSTVGGGFNNQANGLLATVAGGSGNTASGDSSFVGGGTNNTASGTNSVVAGGKSNTAATGSDTVGGGSGNTATGSTSIVGGGWYNTASGAGSTIAGGQSGIASAGLATIGGGQLNIVNANYGTVGGGFTNAVTGEFGTISGGRNNRATADASVIGGGANNLANGSRSTVGGGSNNVASGSYAIVGGGRANTASTEYTTVGGGFNNTASGTRATVGGGYNNTAGGMRSTVPGGENNAATGAYSFAAGRRAKAIDDGTFVWADNQNVDFGSTASNQFLIRASGGIGLNTADLLADVHIVGGATLGSMLIAPADAGSGSDSQILLAEDDDATYGMIVRYDGTANQLQLLGQVNAVTSGPRVVVSRDKAQLGVGGVTSLGDEVLYVEGATNWSGTSYDDMIQFVSLEPLSYGFLVGDDDMLHIEVPSNSSANAEFIECSTDDGDYKFRVQVDGNVYADGAFTGGGADFAEIISVSDGATSVEAGDVLVIDPTGERAVKKSPTARSTLVAGIYSTKPGFIGSEREWDERVLPADASTDRPQVREYTLQDRATEFGEIPMAIVGIVPCKVSTENGAIRPGDLLVTSSTPGHAMRDQDPRVGTVLGKALGSLDSGTGVIKVLLTLQ